MNPTQTDSPESGESTPDVGEALSEVEPVAFSELPSVLIETMNGWLETGVRMLPNLVLAILVMVLAWVGAKAMSRLVRRALDRISDNAQVNQLLHTLLRTALTSVGLFMALGVLNLDKVVTSLLAGVGVVGLALGFAFQDIAANLMSGIIMAVARPFRVGDLIETNDFFGTVEATDLRNTRVRTLSGELVLLPNKDLHNSPLTNYTETPNRRVDVGVGVAYDDDLRTARDAIEDALRSLDDRDEERPIEVFYEGFGGSSIDLVARFWISEATQGKFLHARSEAVIAIKEHLDEADITIPFPIRTLDFGASAVGGEDVDERLKHLSMVERRAAK